MSHPFRYKIIVVVLIALNVILISSCTVHKRVHRKGWFVQWNFKEKPSASSEKNESDHASVELRDSVPLTQSTGIEINTLSSIQPENESVVERTDGKSEKHVPENTGATDNFTKRSLTGQKPLVKSEKHRMPQKKRQSSSPVRVPILAWVLLFLGSALLGIGIILAIVFLISNGSFIGAPFIIPSLVIAGILIIVLASQTALSTFNSQPSSPDQRFEREEPKKEKKERQPLKKGDKIFLAVVAGIVLTLGIVLLSY